MTRRHDRVAVPVETPGWLAQAVHPWRIERAVTWPEGGVALHLASDRARVPVVVERERGAAVFRLADPKTPVRPGSALVNALSARVGASPRLSAWLGNIERLRAVFRGEAAGPTTASLQSLWAEWPDRVGTPPREITPIAIEPPVGDNRAVAATLTYHQLACGDYLPALASWDALGALPADASVIELHLHATCLALLGRRSEALETLASAQASSTDPEHGLACAWLHQIVDDVPGAEKAFARVARTNDTPWDHLRLARVRGGTGAEALSEPAVLEQVPDRASFVLELLKVLEEGGLFDAALRVIDALGDVTDPELCAQVGPRAARLHCWRRDIDRARGWLERLEPDARARLQGIEGALQVLEGHPAEGLEILEEARDAGHGGLELLLWQAEAHLALGRPQRALECIDEHILAENTLAAYTLKAYALSLTLSDDEFSRAVQSPTFLDALFADVIPSLSAVDAARLGEDRADTSELLRGLLDQMGGNRGPHATWCRTGDGGARRLERVEYRPSGRDAAVANLIRIRHDAPDEVLAGFEAVAEEYPRSPHPFTYRGELLIWLGRYDDALASFEQADARALTRWSYVGRAAVHELRGESEQAERWSRDGGQKFGELASATTHVYRGERLRRAGATDDGKRDLEIAVSHKPRRVGARMNLALIHRVQGDEPGWTEQVERLAADAPAFLWEAGVRSTAAVTPEQLERALELMVGNRSSFLHTMIDDNRAFRVVPSPDRLRAHARLTLGLARPALALAVRDAFDAERASGD